MTSDSCAQDFVVIPFVVFRGCLKFYVQDNQFIRAKLGCSKPQVAFHTIKLSLKQQGFGKVVLKLTPRTVRIIGQPVLCCELDKSAASRFPLYHVDQFWDRQLQKFLREFEYKYLNSDLPTMIYLAT